ncbi:hypothetical protein N7454_010083 [Penicillium verhagenii]|nr:hypothetical protein N7454_010083 [Penicillium verhagenii]
MSVQSDAAWLEHESKLATAATEAGEEPPFVPFKLGVRELGHEIWLELILWCCVEHGFNKQGAWLMGQMCELESQPNWKIESWAPLMEAFDLVQQTNISTEQSWRRSGQESSAVTPRGAKKLPFNGLGKRTISSEVVSNLRNGLANVTCTGIGFGGATSAELLDYSRPLTALLDPLALVTTENITRILESGVLKPMEDPVAFEEVLRSTQNLVPSWETDAVPSAEDLDHMTRAQIYDQTAALSGLVQYSIKGYTYKRQATQAFLQYAWLQNIVDASKVQHIQAFFEHHSQSQLTELPFFDSRQLNTSQLQQSSLPQVSLTTLADLLDLATATHAHDFGNWLLFNDDLDGPSIPPAAYGKQVLVPSILRFASATRNNELSQAVIRSLELPLSVNTLKAMANLHMEFADWDRAILAFDNIFTLGAKIIRLESALRLQQEAKDADEEKQKRLNHNLQCAKQLLRRFFKGEFNTPRSKAWRQNDFQWRVLYRARGIFRTLDGELEALAKNTNFKRKFADRDRIHGVPAASFHRLLAAVLDVHGSKIGHEFAAHWLRSTPSPVSWRLLKGGVTRQQRHVERELLAIDPTFKPARFEQYKNEAVVPDLNTIRLVARAAMSELEVAQQEKTEKPESPSASTATTELDVAQQEKIEQLKEKLNPRPRSQGYKLRISKSVCKNMTLKGGRPPSSDPEAVLDWCATFLLRLGMGEETIDLEIPGHTNRLRRRGVLTTTPEKRLRDRFKDIRNSPWMSTSVKIKDADIDEST